VRPQTPHRSPRQAFGGNSEVPACGRKEKIAAQLFSLA